MREGEPQQTQPQSFPNIAEEEATKKRSEAATTPYGTEQEKPRSTLSVSSMETGAKAKSDLGFTASARTDGGMDVKFPEGKDPATEMKSQLEKMGLKEGKDYTVEKGKDGKTTEFKLNDDAFNKFVGEVDKKQPGLKEALEKGKQTGKETAEKPTVSDLLKSEKEARQQAQGNAEPAKEEGKSSTKAKIAGAVSGALMGAAVGFMVAGPAGAIVGAIAGGVAGAKAGEMISESMSGANKGKKAPPGERAPGKDGPSQEKGLGKSQQKALEKATERGMGDKNVDGLKEAVGQLRETQHAKAAEAKHYSTMKHEAQAEASKAYDRLNPKEKEAHDAQRAADKSFEKFEKQAMKENPNTVAKIQEQYKDDPQAYKNNLIAAANRGTFGKEAQGLAKQAGKDQEKADNKMEKKGVDQGNVQEALDWKKGAQELRSAQHDAQKESQAAREDKQVGKQAAAAMGSPSFGGRGSSASKGMEGTKMENASQSSNKTASATASAVDKSQEKGR